ncbi:tol-pal system protein YbgF [Geobacter argillaceus]|uniref:Tol-pal system protein YbgF n=1 Tax=Geobacter argillaceus TaxID=345631 RepID=A0A562V7P0_9BACT|nr:tol-pal system protein YbgF [Geobacter argillaceus]TWJ13914.1 tol-pal system protein YbgF [Geobacter argillaceus]
MFGTKSLVVAVGLLSLGGCASSDIMVQKQTAMDSRLEQLAQATTALVSQVQRLTDEQKGSGERLAALDKEVSSLRGGYDELRRQQAELAAKTAQTAALVPVDAARIEVVNREAGADEHDRTAQDGYMKAFGLFSANNYEAAAAAFVSFIAVHPQSEYVANAHFWLGECYVALHRYPRAIEAFRTVVERFPKGQKAPDALLRIGLVHDAAKEPAKAHAAFREVVEKFPASDAATRARELLLGKN